MYCKSCGKELDASSTFCSNCGSPIDNTPETPNATIYQSDTPEKPKKKKSFLRKILSAVVAAILILAFIKSLDPYRNILNVDTMREAYSCSQEVIRQELLAPSTAEFPAFDPEFVTHSSTNLTYEGIEFDVHTVTAYVDAENAFGVPVRAEYIVEIGFPVSGNRDNYYYNIISFDY